jgi:TolB-like protein
MRVHIQGNGGNKLIGQKILHYRIIEKLGEDGMGVVYKAEDTKLERLIAIKFLPHQIVASAEERERFKIEAKVKIMDFGLAKMGGEVHLTKAGMTLGTAAYMSPEQARGENVDYRTDIWAFGVVLYEMLCGQLPFRGEYEAAMMYSILNKDPQTISSLRHDVPRALEAITRKALAKKAEERDQHIEEVLADLKSPTRTPASETAQAVKPNLSKRKPVFLYGSIAAFLILLIAVALYFFHQPAASIDAIAVLPLTNLSGDPNQEYFADGMTEALISVLGQIEALRVISRTSVMPYKGGAKPLSAMARELNVDAVVEGSVQSSGNRVDISVRLIEARTEKRLWSENFERELRDVLTLQREVTLAITREIKVQVTPHEQARLKQRSIATSDWAKPQQ